MVWRSAHFRNKRGGIGQSKEKQVVTVVLFYNTDIVKPESGALGSFFPSFTRTFYLLFPLSHARALLTHPTFKKVK